jgi:hypothetical protein
VGTAGEVRARLPGRGPEPGQAGQLHRLPDRPAGRAHCRVRAAARRLTAADLRQRRGPARPSHRSGPAVVHRVSLYRPAAADSPHGGRAVGPLQRGGRLAQLLDPRAGRGPRQP